MFELHSLRVDLDPLLNSDQLGLYVAAFVPCSVESLQHTGLSGRTNYSDILEVMFWFHYPLFFICHFLKIPQLRT